MSDTVSNAGGSDYEGHEPTQICRALGDRRCPGLARTVGSPSPGDTGRKEGEGEDQEKEEGGLRIVATPLHKFGTEGWESRPRNTG